MTHQKVWLSLLALVAFSCFFYLIYTRNSAARTIIPLPAAHCDHAKGVCISTLPTGERVELTIKPTFMPVLTSIYLEAKTHKIPVQRMFVDFKGVDMSMGEFRFTLLPQKNGIYSAQTVLPTCVHRQMTWSATVNIESSRKTYNITFQLVNERPEALQSAANTGSN